MRLAKYFFIAPNCPLDQASWLSLQPPARPLAQMKRLLAPRLGSAAEIPVGMLRSVPGLSVGKIRGVQLSLSA